jgi:hypothetical protein
MYFKIISSFFLVVTLVFAGLACGEDIKPTEQPRTEVNQAVDVSSLPTSVALEPTKSVSVTSTPTDAVTATITLASTTTPKTIPTPMPPSATKTVEAQPLSTVVVAVTQVPPTPTSQDIDTSNGCDVLTGKNKENCEKELKGGKKIEDILNKDPCASFQGALKDMCKQMMGANSTQGPRGGVHASNPCAGLNDENKAKCELERTNEASGVGFVKNFDPNNIPKIAKFNFTELDKLDRTSKFRSVTGHDFSFNTSEYDPTGMNCRSMKHYMVPVGTPRKNALYNVTPHTFKWMSIKFLAPADGTIGDVVNSEAHGEIEQQFTIASTEYPGYYFGFYHVKLDPSLGNGSEVTAGQQIGTLGNEESYAEISVEARINSREKHLMSFLEVATDKVFEEYRARGVNSVSDVIITKEVRDANPIGCDRNSEAGWFEGSYKYNADESFMTWVFESSENWFFFDE